jgi:hypothetical protein
MFEFDWHARKQDFVKWMFVHLISGNREQDPKFEKLSEATNKFRNVQLTMQVNGIELDAEKFIEYVEHSIKTYSKNAAKRIVEDSIPDLEELQEAVYNAQRALADKLKNSLTPLGITWSDDE